MYYNNVYFNGAYFVKSDLSYGNGIDFESWGLYQDNNWKFSGSTHCLWTYLTPHSYVFKTELYKAINKTLEFNSVYFPNTEENPWAEFMETTFEPLPWYYYGKVSNYSFNFNNNLAYPVVFNVERIPYFYRAPLYSNTNNNTYAVNAPLDDMQGVGPYYAYSLYHDNIQKRDYKINIRCENNIFEIRTYYSTNEQTQGGVFTQWEYDREHSLFLTAENFSGGIIPSVIPVQVQAAGGAGGWGQKLDEGAAGGGGGSGAYCCILLDFDHYDYEIILGYKGFRYNDDSGDKATDTREGRPSRIRYKAKYESRFTRDLVYLDCGKNGSNGGHNKPGRGGDGGNITWSESAIWAPDYTGTTYKAGYMLYKVAGKKGGDEKMKGEDMYISTEDDTIKLYSPHQMGFDSHGYTGGNTLLQKTNVGGMCYDNIKDDKNFESKYMTKGGSGAASKVGIGGHLTYKWKITRSYVYGDGEYGSGGGGGPAVDSYNRKLSGAGGGAICYIHVPNIQHPWGE